VEIVQSPDEQQVGDLLDHLERVGDPPDQKRVPDLVDLALELTGDHRGRLPVGWQPRRA